MLQAIITYIIVFSAFAYTIYKTVQLFMPQKNVGMCGCGTGCACPKGELLANVKAQNGQSATAKGVKVKSLKT